MLKSMPFSTILLALLYYIYENDLIKLEAITMGNLTMGIHIEYYYLGIFIYYMIGWFVYTLISTCVEHLVQLTHKN